MNKAACWMTWLCACLCGCDQRETVAPTSHGTATPTGFVDVAESAGIDFVHTHGGDGRKFLFETMGSGVAASDFDGDGLPDLLFLQSGTLPADEFSDDDRKRAHHAAGSSHHLYRNLGDLSFENISAQSGLTEPVYAMGLAVGDIDADGDRDLWVACYGDDQLFENDSAAHFSEVTNAAGVSDPRWTVGGAFFDADLDGDLDLYSVAYLDMPVSSHRFCGPRPIRTYCHVDSWLGADDKLWINDGSGHFSDGSSAAGLVGSAGKGLTVAAADYDDDGDFDLFVANDSQSNMLLRNDGGGNFSDMGAMSGTDLNGEGRTEACMGADIGDLDSDGDLDMYVVNYQQETNTLYRNDGDGFFTDVSVLSGAGSPSLPMLGFGTVFVDVESDGDLDIYVANGHIMDNITELEDLTTFAQPDQIFLNDGSGRFTTAPESYSSSCSEFRVGRGVARADLDRDGDMDLLVSNSTGAPWVLANTLDQGHRISLILHGTGGLADAVGARVTVRAGGRLFVREVVAGG
ncbi:MAG: hypothetical protein ACI9EF_002137, partial [Pseudohongiellaceae bacterium]